MSTVTAAGRAARMPEPSPAEHVPETTEASWARPSTCRPAESSPLPPHKERERGKNEHPRLANLIKPSCPVIGCSALFEAGPRGHRPLEKTTTVERTKAGASFGELDSLGGCLIHFGGCLIHVVDVGEMTRSVLDHGAQRGAQESVKVSRLFAVVRGEAPKSARLRRTLPSGSAPILMSDGRELGARGTPRSAARADFTRLSCSGTRKACFSAAARRAQSS